MYNEQNIPAIQADVNSNGVGPSPSCQLQLVAVTAANKRCSTASPDARTLNDVNILEVDDDDKNISIFEQTMRRSSGHYSDSSRTVTDPDLPPIYSGDASARYFSAASSQRTQDTQVSVANVVDADAETEIDWTLPQSGQRGGLRRTD